jgi:quinol monooxygenase YgiN
MTINPGGHVDEVTAEIRADAAGVCFVQVWQVADRDAQQRWLAMMAENIHILQARPGFISMTLHASLDGTRIVVYAQWESDAALRASVDDPEAIVAHEKMAEVGTPDGAVYRVNSIFAPLVLEPNSDPEDQSE